MQEKTGILGALVGATASGKTALAVSILAGTDVEIISADSRQLFKGFVVGTGQPDSNEKQRVKHHLIDFLNPEEDFSAGDYLREVEKIVSQNPQKKFLLVGGTGFYVKAVLEGLPELPSADLDLRKQIEQELAEKGLESLIEKLKTLDPNAKVDTQNPRRIVRALEVCVQTGKAFSSFLKEKKGGLGPFPIWNFGLPPQILHQNILNRVISMFENGWIEEVTELLKNDPKMEQSAFNSLGYREVAQIILNGRSRKKVEAEIVVSTRRYAKRQRSFFKNQLGAIPMDQSKIREEFASLLYSVN